MILQILGFKAPLRRKAWGSCPYAMFLHGIRTEGVLIFCKAKNQPALQSKAEIVPLRPGYAGPPPLKGEA